MSYKVTIFGKSYELPARTLSVDDNIEAISKLDWQYKAGEITRLDAVVQMHSFVNSLVPDVLPPVDEVDTNDLLKACLDIIASYDAPARKARSEAQLAEVKDLINRPEVQSLLKAAQSIKK